MWNDAEYGQGPGRDADDVSVDSLEDGDGDGDGGFSGHAVSGRAHGRAGSRERQQRGKDQSRKGLTKSTTGTVKHPAAAVCDTNEGGMHKDTGYLSREGGLGLGDMLGGEEVDAHVTVGAVSLMVDKSNKRAARLAAKLKRLATEKEELRDRYEALCKRERQVRDKAKGRGRGRRTHSLDLMPLTHPSLLIYPSLCCARSKWLTPPAA